MHARLRLLQQQKPKSASLPGRLIVSGLLCIAATAAHQNKTDRFLEGSLTAVCRAEHFMMLNTSYSLDMPIQLTNGSALLYHRHISLTLHPRYDAIKPHQRGAQDICIQSFINSENACYLLYTVRTQRISL